MRIVGPRCGKKKKYLAFGGDVRYIGAAHQFGCQSLGSYPIRIVVPHVAVARDEVAEEGIKEEQAEEDAETVDGGDDRFFILFAGAFALWLLHVFCLDVGHGVGSVTTKMVGVAENAIDRQR